MVSHCIALIIHFTTPEKSLVNQGVCNLPSFSTGSSFKMSRTVWLAENTADIIRNRRLGSSHVWGLPLAFYLTRYSQNCLSINFNHLTCTVLSYDRKKFSNSLMFSSRVAGSSTTSCKLQVISYSQTHPKNQGFFLAQSQIHLILSLRKWFPLLSLHGMDFEHRQLAYKWQVISSLITLIRLSIRGSSHLSSTDQRIG